MMRLDPAVLHDTLAWVLLTDPGAEWDVADLMARELDPQCSGAVELLTSPSTSLEMLARAKILFKTLRLDGETAEDRRLGSHLYAAAIAAALVATGDRISRQQDDSLRRAFARMKDEVTLPAPLRDLASRALRRLE